ncbi:MAG: ketoacyl-ACP synthase III [Candidatus Tectomicrobia bacterium]|nr:ketoacyl-ACP synthase III [Candidatus Tectomicrobia bacterium]
MTQVCISGVGAYAPSERRTNQDLVAQLGVTEDHIVKLTGIRERRVAGPEEATSDMAFQAAQAALQNAGVEPGDVDGLLVATATADYITPSVANLLQHRLGLRPVPAYDINAGCTGSLYALITGAGLIQAGLFRTVLVVGAELVTRIVDAQDADTALVFGDAAGAVVLQHDEGQAKGMRLLSHIWASDGSKADVIQVPAGGSRAPASHETVDKRQHFIRMNGGSVYRFAVRTLPALVTEVLQQAGRSLDDLTLLVPHQANWRIIEAAMRKLSLARDRVMVNIEAYGNTSSASVLLALHEVCRDRRLQPGDTCVLASFGAGLTWAAVALEMVG